MCQELQISAFVYMYWVQVKQSLYQEKKGKQSVKNNLIQESQLNVNK